MFSKITRFVVAAVLAVLFTARLTAAELPFEVTVTGKGTPVIFIPGYTCSGAVWDATVARFSATHACHVLTIRGFGGVAAAATPFHLSDVKDGIIAYMAQQHLQQVVLVGHSMGGFLAQWVAAEQPQALAGIVVVDALPFMTALRDSTAQATGFDSTAAAQLEAQMRSQTPAQRMQYAIMTAAHLCADSTAHPAIAAWSVAADPHTAATLLLDMTGTDLRAALANIRVPVLSLAAWEPAYGVPQENIRAVWAGQYARTPQLTLHLAVPSRHFIMVDAPNWFFAELDTFIAQTVPTTKK